MRNIFSKRFLRILTLGLALLMTVSGSACGGSGEKKFSGILEILMPNSGITDDRFVKNSTTEAIEEFTGRKANYTQMLGASEENDVSNALLAGEYSLIKMQRGSYDQNIVLDAFYDITDLIQEHGKNLLKIINKDAWKACYYNGRLYSIPERGEGFMYDDAFVFNMKHLKEAGIMTPPSTLSEFTRTLKKLQQHFGEKDSFYHAFSMQGASANQHIISGCFNVPMEFYIDEGGEVKSWIYNEATEKYLHYMNGLYKDGCISTSWSSSTSSNVMELYARGQCSVACLPYWHIGPACEAMAANNNAESPAAALKNMKFVLHLLGDGTDGSVDQREDNGWRLSSMNDIGYFCAIPNNVSEEEAIAAIQWMDAKITDENFTTFVTGKEGVGYKFATKEEYEANKADEDSTTRIVPILEENGETRYYQLLPEYDNIKNNSMYQTGGNPKIQRRFWPLREAEYHCWEIMVDESDYGHFITSPLGGCPVIESWSKHSITARSAVVTYIQQIINAKDDNMFNRHFGTLKERTFPKYWNDCKDDVNAWYKSTLEG